MAEDAGDSSDDSDSGDTGGGDTGERTVISPGVAADGPAVDDAATRIAPQPGPEGRTIIATTAAEKPKAQLVEAGTLINNNYRILALVSAGGMG